MEVHMKRALSATGVALVFLVAFTASGDSAQRKGVVSSPKIPKGLTVKELTDTECKNLGCKIFLDAGCKTDFGDNASHTGHKCVCSSGSNCIDTAK
jgi:hypothetical protein